MPHCSLETQKKLEQRGVNVISPRYLGLPDGSFYYGGGGPHCITLQVPHQLLKTEVARDLAARTKG